MQGIAKRFRRRAGASGRQPVRPARRSRGADRGKRRGQIHADEDSRRRPPARRRHVSVSAGSPCSLHPVTDAARAGISFIHQELNVLDNLDVAGNVFLGREPTVGGPLKLLDRGRIDRETQPYLDRLGLGVSSRTPLSQLSLAQQQMVEIAKALSLQARILIMDEPTSSLTLTETQRLIEVVARSAGGGRQHDLYLAPAGGSQAARRPGRRPARRA